MTNCTACESRSVATMENGRSQPSNSRKATDRASMSSGGDCRSITSSNRRAVAAPASYRRSSSSAASASRAASLACWRAWSARTFAPLTRSPKIRRLFGPPIGLLQRPFRARAMPLGFEARNDHEAPQVRSNVQPLFDYQKSGRNPGPVQRSRTIPLAGSSSAR